MPIVRVSMYDGFSEIYRRQIFESTNGALVAAFKIPDDDRSQLISEFDESRFERPPAKTRQYVIVEIQAFAGRSREAKRALYQAIVRNLEERPGIQPADVLITLQESDLLNWGVQGGKVADEVDLGFSVKV